VPPPPGIRKEDPGPYRHASVVLAGTPAPSPETAEGKYSRPAPRHRRPASLGICLGPARRTHEENSNPHAADPAHKKANLQGIPNRSRKASGFFQVREGRQPDLKQRAVGFHSCANYFLTYSLLTETQGWVHTPGSGGPTLRRPGSRQWWGSSSSMLWPGDGIRG